MKGVRAAFILFLSLVGLVLIRDVRGPQSSQGIQAPPETKEPSLRPASPIDSVQALGDRLRQQGKDPRKHLFWEGYPLTVARRDLVFQGGRRFDVVALVQTVVFTPGDWVERYILLDEAGIVQDVATLYWPSRRRFDIEVVRGPGESSEPYLDIRDLKPERGPDMLAAPYVELGVEPGHSKRVYLSWTGTPGLGKVWIEDGHFKAEQSSK